MRTKKHYLFSLLVTITMFVFSSSLTAQNFEPVGGPYEPDANTMLLLHFDGDFTNQSTLSANAVGHSNDPNGLQFLPNEITGLGQCLFLLNDSKSDSTYVTVADTAALDLTGDWTIEGWINVFAFGDQAGDWRWVPRLVIKPGDEAFWRPNYWVELWGDNRWFQTGFHNASKVAWPAVTSSANTLQPGAWFHLTFIRDDTRKILIQMVHNDQRELVWFGTLSYAGLADQTPVNTAQDLHIGWAGAVGIPTSSVDSWLHGFVDEIRISNLVRNFAVPPVSTSLSQVANQESSVTEYAVQSHVFPFQTTGSLKTVQLHYSNDGENWTSLDMTVGADDTARVVIPQQSTGSIVRYYVTAEDNNGLTAQYPSTGNNPLSFGVYQPNSKILDLDFEQNLTDISDYSQKVDFFVDPQYSTDAMVGNYSYVMPKDADSAYLSVNSPFLTAKEFALDYWFKVEDDTVLPYIRMIIRSASGNHVDQNYYIRTEEAGAISARYQVDPALASRTRNDINLVSQPGVIVPNQWYHIQYERSEEIVIFKVFNEQGELLVKLYDTDNIALNPPRPGVTPLRIGWAGNSWDGTVRKLNGKIDGVKIWNYAGLGLDTTGTVVGVEDEFVNLPEVFELEQNYPNPFNPTTKITYSLAENSKVSLKIYDVLGREIVTLVNKEQMQGKYEVEFNASNLSSGLYIYSLKTDKFSASKKMMLIK